MLTVPRPRPLNVVVADAELGKPDGDQLRLLFQLPPPPAPVQVYWAAAGGGSDRIAKYAMTPNTVSLRPILPEVSIGCLFLRSSVPRDSSRLAREKPRAQRPCSALE